jgi:hypothetical protein
MGPRLHREVEMCGLCCVSAVAGRQIALKLLYYYESLVILVKTVTHAPTLAPVLFYYFCFLVVLLHAYYHLLIYLRFRGV